MIKIDQHLHPSDLLRRIEHMWELSARKIRSIDRSWDPEAGAPVYTVDGKYTTRGWTDWTQGFEVGAATLQFDATGDEAFLKLGREKTARLMGPHVTHFGVHDHGFNNVSTYGNLLRLACEGRFEATHYERQFYELALKASGAVQARRWTSVAGEGPGGAGAGFIHSFNGPHSLFVDTIRTCRSLALAHRLGHVLMSENDRRISLLERLVKHAWSTATWNVYYGEGRDAWDTPGRVAHESIFNTADGEYRCPSSQQGYSALTTWTRGLAWAVLGFAEELDFIATVADDDLARLGGRNEVVQWMRRAAQATADYYIESSPADGIPYWDTGAPGLCRMGNYLDGPSDPYNDIEPIDSSAAAIAAQGLVRLGRHLCDHGHADRGQHYLGAGLTVLRHLLDEPYLSTDDRHQGLILHSVYHRPRGWDYIPKGRRIPCGESSMWGDYHAREAAMLVGRLARDEGCPTFFGAVQPGPAASR